LVCWLSWSPDDGDTPSVPLPQSGPLNHHPTRTPVRERLEEGEWHRGEELQEGDLRLEPRLRGKLRGLSSLRQTLQIDFEALSAPEGCRRNADRLEGVSRARVILPYPGS